MGMHSEHAWAMCLGLIVLGIIGIVILKNPVKQRLVGGIASGQQNTMLQRRVEPDRSSLVGGKSSGYPYADSLDLFPRQGWN